MITASLTDNTLWVEFCDPNSRNSFSLQIAEELASALKSGGYDSVVFHARGRVFCSGGNLSDYASMKTSEAGQGVNRRISEILDTLSHLPVPTFCLVNGDCFGGGLELMSAFDFVYTAPQVLFGFWQRKIALTFGWGGGQRIVDRLGQSKTRALALAAEIIGAHEALEIGLVDEIYSGEKLASAAKEKIMALRRLPKAPMTFLKDGSLFLSEQQVFEKIWWNPEHREILESRKPKKK